MTLIAQQNERNSLIALAKQTDGSAGAWDGGGRPGRYDRASDGDLAIALDWLEADEEAGSVETTGLHLARFGRFIRTTDEQGFVDVKAYETIPEAEAQIAEVADVERQLDEPVVTETTPDLMKSFAATIEADQEFDRACRERILGAR